jgi:hypothetical protein
VNGIVYGFKTFYFTEIMIKKNPCHLWDWHPLDLGDVWSGPDNEISIWSDSLILSSSDFTLIFEIDTFKTKL